MNEPTEPVDDTRYTLGLATLRAIECDLGNAHGLLHGMRVHAPHFKRRTIELFADAFGDRPDATLDRATKLLIAAAAAATQPVHSGALEFQLAAALKAGWAREQLIELIEVCGLFSGWQNALHAVQVAIQTFEKAGETGQRGRRPLRFLGSFAPLDRDGFIVNDTRRENVPEALIEALVDYCRETFGEALVSIYVRGSLARGRAIPGVSDVDAFAVVSECEPDVCAVIPDSLLRRVREAAPLLGPLELSVCSVANVIDQPLGTWAFLVKTQAACVFGRDLAPNLRPYRPGPEIMGEALYLCTRLGIYERRRGADQSSHERRATCEWMMKALVRAAFDLTMDRVRQYTRDLYVCYATFAALYPEREDVCRNALEWAINPTDEPDAQSELVADFGAWIVRETEALVARHAMDLSRYRL
jgi:alkylhydroperoxidase/carboxymuconolactone decarboxylase family protein YurZ